MTVQVDLQNACDDEPAPEAPEVKAWIERAVAAAGRCGDVEVAVRIVDADEMQGLNKDYRDKDGTTNVLSFPAGPVAGMPEDLPVLLGDIVICASVVSDEASEQGKPVADHWAHMLVHGTLHLLGFDHAADAEATEMETLEAQILSGHGISDPYGASGET